MNIVIYNKEIENAHMIKNSISITTKDNLFEIIGNLKDCNELHLVGHGKPGYLDLGTGIDTNALYDNAKYLKSSNIQKIFLWSCNVGIDTEFIKVFSKLTNSVVYSSKDYLGKNKGMAENEFHQMNEVIKNFPFYLSWDQQGDDIDGEAVNDYSGKSVSINSDGTIVAIGAYGNDGNGTGSGHVRIMEYDGSSAWTQLGNDIDGEAGGDQSGYSVSLSSDGTIVAIGAYTNHGNGNNSGHVRIMEYDGSSAWTQLGDDIDGEAAYDESGYSVSLSSDGTIIAIGAIRNNGSGAESGHVRIMEYDGSSAWTQLGDDIDGEAAGDFSGYSVSLSSNGTIVAIGAIKNDSIYTNAGHVRIYQYNDSAWTQLGNDIDGGAENDFCGYSVSINSDGTIVAIGTYLDDGNGINSGNVRIFQYDGSSTWIQQGGDIDGEASGDGSGTAVSLSSDGTIVASGAYQNDGNGRSSGHARIFQYDGSSAWIQLGDDIDGEAAGDFSGYSVSLSSDGSRVAVGANANDGNGSNSGQVKIFEWTIVGSICLYKGTPVVTDQGEIAIEDITTKNTINNKPVKQLVKVKNEIDYLIEIEKDAFGINIPSKTTYVSRAHSINIEGEWKKARSFVNGTSIKINYMGSHYIYNVLLEDHGIMTVNNMLVETLHPENPILKKFIN